jgi:hypothetical protein
MGYGEKYGGYYDYNDNSGFRYKNQLKIGFRYESVIGKTDLYFGSSKMLLGSPSISGEWSTIEGGWIWGNGAFFGLEFGGGYSEGGNSENFSFGSGFNFGSSYDLSEMWGLVYGLSVGVWGMSTKTGTWDYYGNYKYEQFVGFGGPFVKLRWKAAGLELTYRGLMGNGSKDVEYYDYNGHHDDYNSGFGYKSQLKIGWRYESNTRQR